MAFGQTYNLVSDMNLTLVMNGVPVLGAEVTQTYHWHWGEKPVTRVEVTDEEGKVFFPKTTGRAWMGWLPHEPVITQNMFATLDGKMFKLWFMSKHNYDDNGEVPGRKLILRCELTDTPGPHFDTQTFGICTLE